MSNHFGSRRIDIISGFRPYSPTQYTPHSNHNIGHAVDFRVEGVPNEVVRDFCAGRVAEVRCAVLYEKPRSIVACDYVWRTTEAWITFPWSAYEPVTSSSAERTS